MTETWELNRLKEESHSSLRPYLCRLRRAHERRRRVSCRGCRRCRRIPRQAQPRWLRSMLRLKGKTSTNMREKYKLPIAWFSLDFQDEISSIMNYGQQCWLVYLYKSMFSIISFKVAAVTSVMVSNNTS